MRSFAITALFLLVLPNLTAAKFWKPPVGLKLADKYEEITEAAVGNDNNLSVNELEFILRRMRNIYDNKMIKRPDELQSLSLVEQLNKALVEQ